MGDIIELKRDEQVVTLVHPNDLPALWPQLSDLIKEACDWSNGHLDPRSVVDGVLDGGLQLAVFWADEKATAILVICVSQFPTGKKILEVLIAAGVNAKSWTEHEDKIIALAKSAGCSSIRMIGREGLQKVLTTWKRTAVQLEMEIS